MEVLREGATVRPAVRGDNNDLGNYNNRFDVNFGNANINDRANRFGMTPGGFRAFFRYRILKKSNVRRVLGRLELFRAKYARGEIEQSGIPLSNSGWQGYAMMGNTYKLRRQVDKEIDGMFAQPKMQNVEQSL